MVDRSRLVNRRVVVALLLQTVGYAAMLAIFPHSELTSLVETLQVVPTVLLVPVALPAIPALVLTLAIGGVFSVAGLPLESLPAILLANGDVVFFLSASIVAVGSGWINEQTAELEP